MSQIQWTDADEIGYQLCEKFPGTDPMGVRYTDLREWVCGLEGFADDPEASNEGVLEAVQMAWLEYYRDRD